MKQAERKILNGNLIQHELMLGSDKPPPQAFRKRRKSQEFPGSQPKGLSGNSCNNLRSQLSQVIMNVEMRCKDYQET